MGASWSGRLLACLMTSPIARCPRPRLEQVHHRVDDGGRWLRDGDRRGSLRHGIQRLHEGRPVDKLLGVDSAKS
jgi:hypothetical protein